MMSSVSGSPSLETRTFFTLQKRLQHQNLVIAKADKGESLVILSRSDYDEKMIEFLNTPDAKPIKFSLCLQRTRSACQERSHYVHWRGSRQTQRNVFSDPSPLWPNQTSQNRISRSSRGLILYRSDLFRREIPRSSVLRSFRLQSMPHNQKLHQACQAEDFSFWFTTLLLSCCLHGYAYPSHGFSLPGEKCLSWCH